MSGAPGVEATSFAIKMLISNNMAGSIIGKGGETINSLQMQSGTRIKLSNSNEFFPGTSDRVMMLSGETSAILMAQSLVLAKLHEESLRAMQGGAEMGMVGQDMSNVNLKLLIPNPAAGLIIGKAGATIRSIIDETGSRIQISPLNELHGTNERIVNITGSLEAAMKASALVVSKMQEDPAYSTYSNMSTRYNSAPRGMHQGGMGMGMGGGYQQQIQQPGGFNPAPGMGVGSQPPIGAGAGAAGPTMTVTMAVADSMVGAIVGRGGANIREIQHFSGATVKISQKGDYVSGTTDRTITITGTQSTTQAAQYLISQKMQQATQMGGGGGMGGMGGQAQFGGVPPPPPAPQQEQQHPGMGF